MPQQRWRCEYVLPTKQQAAAGLGRIVVREPALGSAYMRLSLAMRRWRLGVTGTRPRARYQRRHTGRRIGRGQRRRMRRMRMMMMEEEGGTGGPTTTAPEEDGAGDGGGDGGGPDPAAGGGELRRDPELRSVACERIAAVSTISTMKVERPRARLSLAPTRLNRRSARPTRAELAGT